MAPDSNRLLLIDDDTDNLDMLSRRLTRQGYAVEVAEDGPSALQKICRCQYDLVLLDQMMPGMSGLDLLRLLRATYSQSELPVIMVTADDQTRTIVEALDQGANDYVVKPVDMPDVTARIQAQLSRLNAGRTLTLLDPLTGLGSRLDLMDRLKDAVARQESAAAPTLLALLLLDLDGFKLVNDSYGHGTGDQLLIEVATRLKETFSACGLPEAAMARTGGDEFGVLIEHFESVNKLLVLAEAILSAIRRPVMVHGLQISIGASLGIAPGVDSPVPTAEMYLRDADLALCRAKELGKNCWQIFDSGLRARAQARRTTAGELSHAVEHGELLAVYQPKIDLATRAMVGFESLMRWRHPRRGLLSPCDFIPLAEETGLIVPIGEWILWEASRQLKTWQAGFPTPLPLSINVNVSVKQLLDPTLVNCVKRILAETGIAPETLKLELTESSLMTDLEAAEEALGSLKALRVGFKLDDFGTGYASLSYLRNLHFDSLKIDRSFISRLTPNSDGAAVVETIVKLAHALHMSVVAEGIETEWQLNELVRLGCDLGQGFYFSTPLEVEAAERLLRACRAAGNPSVHASPQEFPLWANASL